MRSLRTGRKGYLWCLLLLRSTFALEVTAGSSCESICQDSGVSTTNTTDIVCSDADFFSTSTGTKFKNCVECLQTSTAVNGTENDVSWFLYNLRYALDVCLFSYPSSAQNSTSQCATDVACNPLQTALETGDLDAGNETEFQYCTADNDAFQKSQAQCAQCLQSTSVFMYMGNFVDALSLGCQQQPSSGTVLRLAGDLFSQSPLNGTVASSPPTPTPAAATSPNSLPLTAIIGISAGIGGLFLGVAILFCIYWWRQRKWNEEDRIEEMYARRYLRDGGSSITATNANGGDAADSMKDDISHSDYQLPLGSFNTNADFYDKAIKASRGDSPPFGLSIPQQAANQTRVSLPAHPAYAPAIPSSRDLRGKATPPPAKLRGPDPDLSGSEQGYELAPARPRKAAPAPVVIPPSRPAASYQPANERPYQPPAEVVHQQRAREAPPPRPVRETAYRPAKERSPIELSEEHPAFLTPAIANLRKHVPAEGPAAPAPAPGTTAVAPDRRTQTSAPPRRQGQGQPPMSEMGRHVPALTVPDAQKPRGTKKYSPTSLYLQGREDATILGPLDPLIAAALTQRERDGSASSAEHHQARSRERDQSVSGGEQQQPQGQQQQSQRQYRPRRDNSSSSAMGQHRRLSGVAPDDKIVEQRVEHQRLADMAIGSGKSLLYG